MQTERNLKIYEMSGYQYKPTPTIMLKGQWLSELGFEAGTRIKVCCAEGQITIRPVAEENPQSREDSEAGKNRRIRK